MRFCDGCSGRTPTSTRPYSAALRSRSSDLKLNIRRVELTGTPKSQAAQADALLRRMFGEDADLDKAIFSSPPEPIFRSETKYPSGGTDGDAEKPGGSGRCASATDVRGGRRPRQGHIQQPSGADLPI